MWFDISVIVGAIVFNVCLFLKGLKVDEKKEVLKWTLLITTWYSLAGNAIICWLLPMIYLSDGLLWQEIFKWSLRYGAMGLAAYYYLLPLFRGSVEPNQVGARKFLWDPNGQILKNLRPGWYYYVPILFGLYKESAEIEKVEVPILEVLSKRARKEMKELEDRIMLDKAVLSVRYRITDLKKLIPKMEREKAEDYIKDEATSLLRANIALRSLAGTIEEWKAIEKAIKQGMLPLKNFGVTISTVLIHNLKVPRAENKKQAAREAQKTKNENADNETEKKTDDKDEPKPKKKKKGFTGVAVGVVLILIVAAITVPRITDAIRGVNQRPKETQQRITVKEKSKTYKLQVPIPVQLSSREAPRLSVVEPSVRMISENEAEVVVPPIEAGVTVPLRVRKGQVVTIEVTDLVDIGRGPVGPGGHKNYGDYTMDSPFKFKVGGLEMWVGPDKNANRYFVGSSFSRQVEHSGDSITLRVIESLYGYHDGNTGAFKTTIKVVD